MYNTWTPGKVICDPCDIILTILKEDYIIMLYTKYRDRGLSTLNFTFLGPRILYIWGSYINGGHFQIQVGRNMICIRF